MRSQRDVYAPDPVEVRPAPRAASGPVLWAMALVVLAGSAWLLALPEAGSAQATPVATASLTAAEQQLRARAFEARSLNLLLLELIAVDDPPRWIASGTGIGCADPKQVLLNGQPLPSGDLVPVTFRLDWAGTRCGAPGDDILEISGAVTLWVSHEGDRYVAKVVPHGLQVKQVDGTFALQRTFEAQTPLAAPDVLAGKRGCAETPGCPE